MFFRLSLWRTPDTKFEELELFGVTNLVEHPAQISPPGKFMEYKKSALYSSCSQNMSVRHQRYQLAVTFSMIHQSSELITHFRVNCQNLNKHEQKKKIQM